MVELEPSKILTILIVLTTDRSGTIWLQLQGLCSVQLEYSHFIFYLESFKKECEYLTFDDVCHLFRIESIVLLHLHT